MFFPQHIELRSSRPAIASHWNFSGAAIDAFVYCDARSQQSIAVSNDGRTIAEWQNPLDALAWISDPETLQTNQRWIGYLSYDLGRHFETYASTSSDDLHAPLLAFARCTANSAMNTDTPGQSAAPPRIPADYEADAISYQRAVTRAIDYIRAGDIFQANIAQRITLQNKFDPRTIFRHLTETGGADYGALLDFGDIAVVSDSPELFLRVSPDRRVINRPIKGTRPNTRGMCEELEHSAKDKAELAMIVDLQRNDLGRVCKVGSVKVIEARQIESHPSVLQAVATIEGQLRDDVGFVDLLRATFPCGSVTGAPKIRAMQIIDELEPFARGPYCGAIGYIDHDRSIEFNVAIRTIVFTPNAAHVSVGGGIVADSDAASEYDETMVKAKRMLDALSYTPLASLGERR